jgi:hypothetical protein
VGDAADDIRAFTDAIDVLSVGDSVSGIYTLGGTSFATQGSTLHFTGSSGLYALTVACNQSSPLLWIAGGVNGKLSKSTNGTTWTLITAISSGWGTTAAIRKVYFAITANGVGQWRIVGDSGKCAYSLDNGITWTMDVIPSWGTANINDISYLPNTVSTLPGTWMIAGDAGQVAYLPGDLAALGIQWVMTALPGGEGTVTNPNPPHDTISAVPWGTASVRAVANGNQVWMIGGGDSSTTGLLARSTNLTPVSGTPIWTFAYPGNTWGNNYITSIAFDGTSTWVVTGVAAQVAYSVDDGATWISATLPTDWSTANVNNVIFEYGVWTLVGDRGKIATSTDGITWSMGSAAPTVLGTANLRASAHGSSSNGIEHLIVGDSTYSAYSNSTNQSAGTLTVAAFGQLSISFDSDITTWVSTDPITKTILLTLNTQRSVECELVGVPTNRIPLFSLNNNLILPTVTPATSSTQANRVYYPHLNPSFVPISPDTLEMAGYPLYSEDPTQYYLDASSNPVIYSNSAGDSIYLCDSTGNYVTNQYVAIPVSSFINYVNASVTTFNDSRQASYAPKYSTYAQWISSDDGRLVLDTTTLTSNSISSTTTPTSSKIVFTSTLPALLSPGDNILILTIMPSAITGTVSSEDTPTYVASPPSSSSPAYQINSDATGIYMPDGGYGTWMGYDHTNDGAVANNIQGDVLPWVGDTLAFYLSAPLVNIKGSPVWFCNSDGTFRLTTPITITSISATSSTLTVNYAVRTSAPYAIGTVVMISGTTNFNGAWTITSCDTTHFRATTSVAHATETAGTVNALIRAQAPVYFTFQELVTNLGREIDQGGCKGSWDPTTGVLPSNGTYLNDYFTISQTALIGATTYTQRDRLVWNGTTWIDASPPTALTVVKLDTANNIITFSGTLPVTVGGTLRVHMLTLSSFVPTTTTLIDSRLIYPLTQFQLDTYTPDRTCVINSAYPPYIATDPDSVKLYLSGLYTNANAQPIYYCDANGNYAVSDGATIPGPMYTTSATTLTDLLQPQTPKYRICQDWYMAEQYLETQESNPYWQYLIVRDVFDPKSKTWGQIATMNHTAKSLRQSQLIFQEIPDGGDNYLTVQQGLQYTLNTSAFSVAPTKYLDYRNGVITLLMVGNPAYDPASYVPPATLSQTFERYGIAFSPNSELPGISSTTNISHTAVNGELRFNFYTNTTQNFANTQDKKGAVVAITEMGVFNTDNNLIAYATFPPIIYDSANRHLSLNLFIKQGEFSVV